MALLQIEASSQFHVSVAINGVRYDYYFHGSVEEILHTTKTIARYSSSEAIKYLNRTAYKIIRINDS